MIGEGLDIKSLLLVLEKITESQINIDRKVAALSLILGLVALTPHAFCSMNTWKSHSLSSCYHARIQEGFLSCSLYSVPVLNSEDDDLL